MTDYIEWVLEALGDEEELEAAGGREWTAQGGGPHRYRNGAPGSSRPTAVSMAEAWGDNGAPMGGMGLEPTRAAVPTAIPLLGVGVGALRGTGGGGGRSPRPTGGEEGDRVCGRPQSTLWDDDSLGEGALRGTGATPQSLRDSSPGRGAKTLGTGFVSVLRRTAVAAARVEQRGMLHVSTAETEGAGAAGMDPAALDLVYQRDARRYDGGFTLY